MWPANTQYLTLGSCLGLAKDQVIGSPLHNQNRCTDNSGPWLETRQCRSLNMLRKHRPPSPNFILGNNQTELCSETEMRLHDLVEEVFRTGFWPVP
jgi:hypothetical protein